MEIHTPLTKHRGIKKMDFHFELFTYGVNRAYVYPAHGLICYILNKIDIQVVDIYIKSFVTVMAQ